MGSRSVTAVIRVVALAIFMGTTGKADLSANLVAHYTFTGNADDVSGNGNNGTVYGTELTTDRFGNPNAAYLFDGRDDYIDCGNGPSTLFNSTDSFTLAAWVKYAGSSTFSVIAARHDDTSHTFTYAIGVGGSGWVPEGRFGLLADYAHVDALWLSASTDLVVDVWQHVVGVYDNGIMRVYIDGELEGIDTFTAGGSGDTSAKFLIGNTGPWPGYPDDRYFHGVIDELAVYNRVLTDAEIHDLSVVPVPGAALLGALGLSIAGWRLRRRTC